MTMLAPPVSDAKVTFPSQPLVLFGVLIATRSLAGETVYHWPLVVGASSTSLVPSLFTARTACGHPVPPTL
jgi:hypothetical protein